MTDKKIDPKMVDDLINALRLCAAADWQIPTEVLEAQVEALNVLDFYNIKLEDGDCD